MERQCYREHRASTLRIAYRYLTLHCRDQLADYPQSDAEAATTIILSDRALEPSEDALPVGLGNAGTVIPNLEADLIADRFSADVHRLTRAVFDGVGQEIVEDLLHGQTIQGSREARGRIDADRAARVMGSLGVCPDDLS